MPSPSLTLLRTQSDARLTELARAGHERAFEAIVERYRRPLLRAARRVLPEGRAEDALQQALLSAWTALGRGDEVHELRPWLYRIVHNTSLNALRVSGYDYDELHDALRIVDGGTDELERRALMRQTLTSLAALPERQREALLRTAVSGDSQQEVARDLGLSDNALRQLVHRARVSMRTAATALTPLPLVTAAASRPRGGPLMERVVELVGGAAGGGASVTLAKAGTAAVLASSVFSGPVLVDRLADRPPHGPAAAVAATPEPARAAPVRAVRIVRAAGPAVPQVRVVPVRRGVGGSSDRKSSGRRGDEEKRIDERSPVRAESEERSGRRQRGDEDEAEVEHRSGSNSGPGAGSGSDSSGSTGEPDEPSDSVEDSSGPGPGGAPEPRATETPEPVEIDGDSHKGSGGSGDGSSEEHD
jgi:RNA polymerase sigma factor (sigma-70 family)